MALFLARLANTDVAAIAAFSSMITALVASGVTWWGSHHKNEVDETVALFDAYNDVVSNLQNEIHRLQDELAGIRSEMQKCENSNQMLSKEIKDLKKCIDRLSADTEKIESMITTEYLPEEF
jgi:hypothetical protein